MARSSPPPPLAHQPAPVLSLLASPELAQEGVEMLALVLEEVHLLLALLVLQRLALRRTLLRYLELIPELGDLRLEKLLLLLHDPDAGLEVRLVVHSFKPQLSEKLHPTRWPTNLYRDDEFKTTIQALRHSAVVDAAAKVAAHEPALVGKGDVASNIVASKGDDWNFKEGNTVVVTLGTGKKAAPAGGAAKVKGTQNKRMAKAMTKMVEDKKKKMPATARTVEKVMKFTPGKKPVKGKQSTSGKKPAASPGGKKSAVGTTDQMTMQTLKKFIQYQKGGKKAATVLGKKAAGKKSATK